MESTEILVVALMVFVNAIFAAYEIALASVSVSRLQLLQSQNRTGATAALFMKQEIEKSLAVVQLGITLVGLVAGAAGGASATDDLSPRLQAFGLSPATANVLAIIVVVLPLTAITIVGGELLPKLFALRNKEWVCLRFSPMMKMFAGSVWPVVWALEASASGLMDLSEKLWTPKPHADSKTESVELLELRAIANLARASRLIGAREENIILGAARLASRPLKEIVLAAEHIRMLNADGSLMDSLVAAHLDMHTRFPVAERPGDAQSIIGYVTFKDIVAMLKLSPDVPSLRAILRQIPSLKEDLPIAEAMERLLREHTHIALVRDHADVVKGMITLEDIVEEMIGDIQDEHDLLPNHCVRSGGGWVVGGGISLPKLKEITGIDLTTSDTPHNLSGWMIDRIGKPPEGGEVVTSSGVVVLVRKVRRQRVLEAALRLSTTPDTAVRKEPREQRT
jgi:putative hemolysin